MLKVKKSILLIIAGIVWLTAGINILRIGALAYIDYFRESGFGMPAALFIILSALIFTGFFFMFFRIVKKHVKRILSYPGEKKPIWFVFDLKGYLLMIFMMGLGIGLRMSGMLPNEFFAVFYSGLGLGLTVAGVLFIVNKFTAKEEAIK